MKVSKSTYKGIDSLVLESNKLRIELLPSIGAKVASIIHKDTGKEYLWQEPVDQLQVPQYDTHFESWGMFGFDEMFPTISECYYQKEPWKGTKLPDHGEVWAIPWHYEVCEDSLHMWVYGVRMPYRLDKWISFSTDTVLHTEYQATNLSNFDFDFIWAAHPLFNIEPGTLIKLPPSVKTIINTSGGRARLGHYGKLHSWPITTTDHNEEYRVEEIHSNQGKHFEKYYAFDQLNQGWAAFFQPTTKEVIAYSFPVDTVPYLGLWINEGGYWNQYNAALEPCTGAFDRVDVASQWGKVSVLRANKSYNWHLNLTISRIDNFTSVNPDGSLK